MLLCFCLFSGASAGTSAADIRFRDAFIDGKGVSFADEAGAVEESGLVLVSESSARSITCICVGAATKGNVEEEEDEDEGDDENKESDDEDNNEDDDEDDDDDDDEDEDEDEDDDDGEEAAVNMLIRGGSFAASCGCILSRCWRRVLLPVDRLYSFLHLLHC
jgi:hypothetical protein